MIEVISAQIEIFLHAGLYSIQDVILFIELIIRQVNLFERFRYRNAPEHLDRAFVAQMISCERNVLEARIAVYQDFKDISGSIRIYVAIIQTQLLKKLISG